MKIFISLLILSPLVAFAAPTFTLAQIGDIAVRFLDTVATLLFGFAAVIFLYGVGKTILNLSSEEGIREGKTVMTYGLISLFVIASLWGILRIGKETLRNPNPPPAQSSPIQSSSAPPAQNLEPGCTGWSLFGDRLCIGGSADFVPWEGNMQDVDDRFPGP